MNRSKGFLARRLAQRLVELRGMESQNRFCRKLGVSNATLNRLENQQQNVSLETLEKFCLNLNCDIGDLFAPEEPP